MNYKLTITKAIGDIDYTFHITVTDFINIHGTYDSRADNDYEYWGEASLEYDIIKVEWADEADTSPRIEGDTGNGKVFFLVKDSLEPLFRESDLFVESELYQEIWEAMVGEQERQRGEE